MFAQTMTFSAASESTNVPLACEVMSSTFKRLSFSPGRPSLATASSVSEIGGDAALEGSLHSSTLSNPGPPSMMSGDGESA